MDGGDEARAEIRAVRDDGNAMRLAQPDHPDHLADTANLGDARLGDVDGAGLDQRLEAEQPGGVFAGDLRSLFFPNKSPMSKKLM